MKKLLYAATALAIFAGCSKDLNEAPANVSSHKGNSIELNLTVAPDSRAIFDGDSHIKWEDGDKLAIAVASDATAETGIGAGSLDFNGDNENPMFSGKAQDISSDPGTTITVFGIYPYVADKSYGTALAERVINMTENQNPTQEHWDGKADIMVIEPKELTGTTETYKTWEWGGYVDTYRFVAEKAEIKFAHIFGFGCITFDSLPEEALNEPVNKFSITATGENKNLSGYFKLDLRKNAFDEDFAVSQHASYTLDYINIACDGTVALKDYKAWFVANPGVYDVEISVTTPNYYLTFNREGLKIERSKIAYPVINFKDGKDALASTAVDLSGGKTWVHDTVASYKESYSANFLSSSKNPVEWGTGEGTPKVEYKMTFSKDESNYPGGYDNLSLVTGESKNVQKLNNNNLTPDKGNVAIKSGYAYIGINCIKVSSGLHTYGDEGTCEISAFIVDKDGVKHQLGEPQKVVANTTSSKAEIFDYYFFTEKEMTGAIELVWDNFTYGRAFLSLLAINPAPDIKVAKNLSLYGQGGEGSVDVEIFNATETTVTSDADWLKVSYSDGKINYTADPYSGDELSRKATITITSTGFATSTETIAVSQLSSQFAEFVLTIMPDDLTAALEKAKAEYEAENGEGSVSLTTNLNFTETLTAVIADGSGETKDVELYFNKVQYGTTEYTSSTNNEARYIKLAYGWTDANNGDIYNLSTVDKVTKIVLHTSSTSSWNNELFVGNSNDAIKTKISAEMMTNSVPYVWEGAVDESSEYGFFKVHQGTGNEIYQIVVTFITKKAQVSTGYGDHGDTITSNDGNYNW